MSNLAKAKDRIRITPQTSVLLLNPEEAKRVDKLATFSARLCMKTLIKHDIETLEQLSHKPAVDNLVHNCIEADHAQLFRLNMIQVLVVGCSRRFLAQITRHKVGVEFVSTSLHFSEWLEPEYINIPEEHQQYFKDLYLQRNAEVGRDLAGYCVPQGQLGTLLISATPWEWRHMFQKRTCNRSTAETQLIMEGIRELLAPYSEVFNCGPRCTYDCCKEMAPCYQGCYDKAKEDKFVHLSMPDGVGKN